MAQTQDKPLQISIAVCARRWSQQIEILLESLREQKPTEEFALREIFFVWNSEPSVISSSSKFLEAYLRDHWHPSLVDVNQIGETRIGIPHARNAALARAIEADDRFLAFVDDDCFVWPTWLTEMTSSVTRYQADVVAGGWRIAPAAIPSSWLPDYQFGPKHYQPFFTDASSGEHLRHAYTRNVIFSIASVRGLPAEHQLFVEDLDGAGGSDVMFFHWLSHFGGKIVYAPEAVVTETYADDRLRLRWHFLRRIRTTQNRLIRRKMTMEPLGLVSGGLRTLLEIGWKIPIALFGVGLTPFFPWFRSWIGEIVLKSAPYFAWFLLVVGIRYREYLKGFSWIVRQSPVDEDASLKWQRPDSLQHASETRPRFGARPHRAD